MANVAFPSNAWRKARERFIEDLEEPERQMFADASLENVFYSASAAWRTHQEGSRSLYLASKLDSLLAGIDQYGKAMDVLSQASPFICPLWGALRVLIHFQTYFTVLIDMFEQIGDVIPRFQAYGTLFSSSPRLIHSLSNAYLDVAKFCTSTKAVFQKARKSVINARILLKTSWKPIEQQHGTLLRDFRRHRESVEKDAELAHFLEAGEARAVGRVYMERQDKQKSEAERIRLLSLLSSIQWRQQHHRILDMKHPGTGTWILTQEIFERWKNAMCAHEQQPLWCYGIPGSGKTILTASVIDSLSQEVNRPDIAVAYFYCDYAEQETLDCSVIIGTIIQQLLISRRVIDEVIAAKIRKAYDDGLRKASLTELVSCLERIILDSYRRVYIVLDGVDEASTDAQEKLFSNFAKLSASCSTLLRLYISTREITLISHHFPSCLNFDVSESRVSQDIELYVKSSVQERLCNLPVMVRYPYLEQSAIRELTAKARGLFLWVSLQIEELCDLTHSERSFTSALQDLPEGLTATYERICQRISRRSLRQRSLAERIFNWTICARRPLRLEELKEAVAIDLDDVSWDGKKISAETDGKRFLSVCGNLAVYHERDSTVRLAHHTVEKFFVQHKKDRSKTDATIGEICLTYLSFSDFEFQLSSARKKQDMVRAQASTQSSFNLILKLLGIGDIVYNSIIRLYNWNRKSSLPDVSYGELTRRYRKNPLPESLAQKYQLLDYVTANWIWHAKNFDPKVPKWWNKFSEFVFHKSLPFDFRSWDSLKGPCDLPHIAVYLWALGNDHLPLLLLLRDLPGSCSLRPYLDYKVLCPNRIPPHFSRPDAGGQDLAVAFHEYPEAYDWPVMNVLLEGTAEMRELCLQQDPSILSNRYVMTRALSDINSGLLKSLLRGGAKFQKADVDITHALHNARDPMLVKILLDIGADPNFRLYYDDRGRTPLFEVVMSEITRKNSDRELYLNNECPHSTLDLMELLLDYGADPNAKQIGEETVLHKAISLGEAYVRLLLSRGADVNARDDQQRSILDLATDTSDHIIDILVEYNVDLDAKDSDGQTALLKAAQMEPECPAGVEALIRHGANVHAKNHQGRTVLHYWRSSIDGTFRHLVESGVAVNAEDDDGATPLDFAVRQSDINKYKLLLDFGGVHGEMSVPPLIETVGSGDMELLNLLLRNGADPNLLGTSETSALSSAVEKGDKEILSALIKAGADPNLVGSRRLTPLTRAIKSENREIVRMLIDAGASIHPPDSIPYGPMYFAIGSGDVSMVEFLFQQGADVSRLRPYDMSGLRTRQLRMCEFVRELAVPFNLSIQEYDYD